MSEPACNCPKPSDRTDKGFLGFLPNCSQVEPKLAPPARVVAFIGRANRMDVTPWLLDKYDCDAVPQFFGQIRLLGGTFLRDLKHEDFFVESAEGRNRITWFLDLTNDCELQPGMYEIYVWSKVGAPRVTFGLDLVF